MDATSTEDNSQYGFHSIEDIDLNDNLVDFEKMNDDASSDDQSHDSINEVQYGNIDSTIVPHIGMEFPNEDIAYDFYKNFALIKGFATRLWHITAFFGYTYSCNDIFSQKKSRMRSNKKANQESHNKIVIDDYHSCGIGPSKIARLINVSSHGSSKIIPQQVSDHLKISRKSNIGKECRIVLEKLMERQAREPQFYYTIEVDENQKTFFAGMKSSQRSESINAFFDGFVHSSTSLSEFVDQYDNAITDRREKEEDQDFICMTTKPDLTKVTPIESYASQIYTKNVFVRFKEEFDCVFHCLHKKLKKDGDKSTYQVTHRFNDKVVSHVVNVTSDCNFECSCAKFETAGLLCKHILSLMKQKYDFTSIPEKYILPRWTLNARQATSTSQISQITIRDPTKCKTKGRPKKAARILSGKQASQLQKPGITLVGFFDRKVYAWDVVGVIPDELWNLTSLVSDKTIYVMNMMYSAMKANMSFFNLWQLDGRPMSGDIGRGATREAIAFAVRVAAAKDKPQGFLQLAGGTNAHTVDGLRKHRLFQTTTTSTKSENKNLRSTSPSSTALIGGVAYGGYARKIVGRILNSMQALHGHAFIEDHPEHLVMALTEALALVGPIKCYPREIPKELGKLTDLRSLSFSSNNFSGPQLGSLTKLEQLYASKNCTLVLQSCGWMSIEVFLVVIILEDPLLIPSKELVYSQGSNSTYEESGDLNQPSGGPVPNPQVAIACVDWWSSSRENKTFERFTTKSEMVCTLKLDMLCVSVNTFVQTSMTEINTEQGLHVIDSLINDAKSKLHDLQIRIDDAKCKLRDLQTLHVEVFG
ncbi:hypothetical protein POM88_006990 [Heracleum sosnowskyi]|uniref:Protein FAR1-RELATED SEQUENCE n=1 Tax=Heracleum sosnowskyi TaxID=360622 RepID=A0AAD8N5U6_9APIA|nr:hypothetical protein POM88_006990 [Heracleum sosnowskyi]